MSVHPEHGSAECMASQPLRLELERAAFHCLESNLMYGQHLAVFGSSCPASHSRCAGSFDNFLNIQIVLIILLQIAMCVLHGGLGLWWRNAHGVHRYALALTITGQV
jgi:hypothetical protein